MRYLAAILEELARAALWLTIGFLLALGFAFAIAHTIDTWSESEHEHSGFSPDYYTAHLHEIFPR